MTKQTQFCITAIDPAAYTTFRRRTHGTAAAGRDIALSPAIRHLRLLSFQHFVPRDGIILGLSTFL